jgi:CsoR family transcriptional regulator, copper-sensing transcriptional repressor
MGISKIELRINRIVGQLSGIKKMLQSRRDCSAILLQIAAIKAAVNNLGLEIAKSAVCELPEEQKKKIEAVLKEVSRI